MPSNVRIGTSGWHYPTGRGTWNGIFYPVPRARPKAFDELSFYAEHFDTVEVNSTFYGQPRPDVSRTWAQRTPEGFEFSVKLYQKFTHPGMFKQTLTKSLSKKGSGVVSSSDRVETTPDPFFDEPAGRDVLEALARPNQADLDSFRAGIEPLAAAGKLGAILAQFPPSFKDAPPSREYLVHLLRALRGYPVAVELRHRSWSDRIGETLALLNEFSAAWVQIDEPKFRFSIRQNYLPNVQGFYYMRLHGRNVENWWRPGAPEDRYDYLYSADELKEFSGTADAARTLVKKLYLYTNNHFSAKSVANAAMIKKQLGQPVDGAYLDEFVARYPDLAGTVNRRSPASDRASDTSIDSRTSS
jgi:uncharacterized protein YecE (DUF72 family)